MSQFGSFRFPFGSPMDFLGIHKIFVDYDFCTNFSTTLLFGDPSGEPKWVPGSRVGPRHLGPSYGALFGIPIWAALFGFHLGSQVGPFFGGSLGVTFAVDVGPKVNKI